jgi:hypothetical protein
MKAFERELAFTLYTRHPNILAPIGVAPQSIFPTQSPPLSDMHLDRGLFLVYPYLSNGTLDSYVHEHPRVNIMFLVSQSAYLRSDLAC